MRLNGPVIKALMFERRIRQWQLAKALNLPEVYMSRLIQGRVKPSEKLANKLAEKLGVRLEVILKQEEVEKICT